MFEAFDPTQIKVALLAGGTSGEREISLKSGKGALGALTEAGYQVTELDPANKEDLMRLIEEDFDVAFLCTHGRKGEDGTIQGFLEMINLPYTGSGVEASAVAMNKVTSKMVYEKAGIQTAASLSLNKGEKYDLDEIINVVTDHCVVKAAKEGSSLGVFIVEGKEALEQALVDVFDYDDSALIEQYVSGTELTVAVIGNEDAIALPIIEIIPQNASYDFESKYAPGGSEHICPARLPEEIAAKIQAAGVRAHHALGCAGVSRTDFIVDEAGESWVLETNTLPGMTGTSLLPDAARAAGISFPELCTKLIQSALSK